MKKFLSLMLMLGVAWVVMTALAEPRPTLSYNSKGEAVIALQERLTELGYYTFRITGVYQENTQKAVREYQAQHGLVVDGIANDALQQMIFSPDASPKLQPTPLPIAMDVAFPGILQYGSSGEDVRRVQTRLYQFGFYNKNITGNYGNETKNAVRAFQAHNGLKNDGVVGQATWQALFFDEESADATATPRPSPTPPPVPYRVEVNVTTQVITVFGLDEYGEHTNIVRQMICSTGTDRDPTPLKTYTLNGRKERWAFFPKWGTHAQYWTRMDASNAFHSVIYREPDEMALATGSYTGLGKPASHGCIRLMVEDAKWIYDNCGKGTEVLVYMGDPDPELTQSLRVPKLDRSRMLPMQTAAPTPKPAYRSDALPPMPFETLRKGTEGEAVYWLQMKLTEMGYYKGSVTGGYYEGTVEAVRAFQRDHGLSADGVAGKMTLSKLYEDLLATPSPVPTATPTAMPSMTPFVQVMPTPTANPSAMIPSVTGGLLQTQSPESSGTSLFEQSPISQEGYGGML